jgi:hypothetical protein
VTRNLTLKFGRVGPLKSARREMQRSRVDGKELPRCHPINTN